MRCCKVIGFGLQIFIVIHLNYSPNEELLIKRQVKRVDMCCG